VGACVDIGHADDTDGRDGAELGATRGAVLGTYLHGLFADRAAREAVIDATYASAGIERPTGAATDERASPYERAAALVDPIDLGVVGIDD